MSFDVKVRQACYISFILAISLLVMISFMTLGSYRVLDNFHLSNVFLNMWEHFVSGDLNIDPEAIGAEGFLIEGQTKAYFLPFPALIRGFLTIFDAGSSSVISVAIAGFIYLLSSSLIYIQMVKECDFNRTLTKYCSILFLSLLVSAPPILGLLTFPDVFTEAITWGYSLFMLSIYLSIQCIANLEKNRWIILYALTSGLTLFTRPPYLVASSLLFCITLFVCFQRRGLKKTTASYWGCYVAPISVFLILLVILGIFNYQKWGNPFEFYPLQYYLMYSKQDFDYLQSIGSLSLSRIPEALSYYFLPSSDNFASSIPWLKTGSHNYFDRIGAPVNYREPTYPISITMPWYLFSSILGAIILCFYKKGREGGMTNIASYLIPSIFASCVLIAPILCLHANAWRYIGEFIPAITLLSILGWINLLHAIENSRMSKIKIESINGILVHGVFTLLLAFVIFSSLYFSLAAVLRKDVFWKFWQIDSAYVSQSSPIKPNRIMVFDQGLSNQYHFPFLTSGWGEPEKTHTWSVSDNASMQFLLPPAYSLSTMTMKIKALVSSAHPKQVVDIYVNKKLVLHTIIDKPTEELEIPISSAIDNKSTVLERAVNISLKPNILQIDFIFENSASPKELGIGDDTRKLAIAVQSVVFR